MVTSPSRSRKTYSADKSPSTSKRRLSAADQADDDEEVDELAEDDDEEDEEAAYEVEAVVGHRFSKKVGEQVFLVKWKGYPEEENTWEPEANFASRELIDAYWATVPGKNQPGKKKAWEAAQNKKTSSNGKEKAASSSQKRNGSASTRSKPTAASTSHRRVEDEDEIDAMDEDEDEVAAVASDADQQQQENADEEDEEQETIDSALIDATLSDEQWKEKETEWKKKWDPLEDWEDVVEKVSSVME